MNKTARKIINTIFPDKTRAEREEDFVALAMEYGLNGEQSVPIPDEFAKNQRVLTRAHDAYDAGISFYEKTISFYEKTQARERVDLEGPEKYETVQDPVITGGGTISFIGGAAREDLRAEVTIDTSKPLPWSDPASDPLGDVLKMADHWRTAQREDIAARAAAQQYQGEPIKDLTTGERHVQLDKTRTAGEFDLNAPGPERVMLFHHHVSRDPEPMKNDPRLILGSMQAVKQRQIGWIDSEGDVWTHDDVHIEHRLLSKRGPLTPLYIDVDVARTPSVPDRPTPQEALYQQYLDAKPEGIQRDDVRTASTDPYDTW